MFDSLAKPENAAAVWSAVAATFSALAAYLSWRAQVHTLRHTFRPELLLSGWQRAKSGDTDVIAFTHVTNIGRGTAQQIIINAFQVADDDRPIYFMSTINIPTLAPNERAEVDASIELHWKVAPKNLRNAKVIFPRIDAWYWDAVGVRHITTVSLFVTEHLAAPAAMGAQVATGVSVSSQSTKSVPVWWLKARRCLAGVPIIGRNLRSDA